MRPAEVRRLFRRGLDTLDIARILRIPEAEVYRLLHAVQP